MTNSVLEGAAEPHMRSVGSDNELGAGCSLPQAPYGPRDTPRPADCPQTCSWEELLTADGDGREASTWGAGQSVRSSSVSFAADHHSSTSTARWRERKRERPWGTKAHNLGGLGALHHQASIPGSASTAALLAGAPPLTARCHHGQSRERSVPH